MAASVRGEYAAGMTRFYFNLYECGRCTPDHEGVVLADLAAARKRAVAEARAIMSAEVGEGRLCLGCNIEVIGEDGRPALNLPFKDALTVSGI